MADRETRVAERQDGDYRPPILVEPEPARPVPPWQPAGDESEHAD